jgi:hypothetical protein
MDDSRSAHLRLTLKQALLQDAYGSPDFALHVIQGVLHEQITRCRMRLQHRSVPRIYSSADLADPLQY